MKTQTTKNHLALYFHFIKILKGSGASIGCSKLNQKHAWNAFLYYVGFKRNNLKCNFHCFSKVYENLTDFKMCEFYKNLKI